MPPWYEDIRHPGSTSANDKLVVHPTPLHLLLLYHSSHADDIHIKSVPQSLRPRGPFFGQRLKTIQILLREPHNFLLLYQLSGRPKKESKVLLHLVEELLARRQLRINARVVHAQHILCRAQVAGEEGPDEWLQLLREEACGRRRDKRKGEDELAEHVPEEWHVQTRSSLWWRRERVAEVGERRQARKRRLGGGNGVQLVRELERNQRFLEVMCSEWRQG